MSAVLPVRLDWPSAIGLFIVNFGTLDVLLLGFLQRRVPANEFAGLKKLHLKDRVARLQRLLGAAGLSAEQVLAFDGFFRRLEPLRQIRNRIAHGHLQILATEGGDFCGPALVLPRDLDTDYDEPGQRLEFAELTKAGQELTALIEEFKRLSGDWTDGERFALSVCQG